MSQSTRPGWNSSVSTSSARTPSTTSRPTPPSSSKSIRRKPVPALGSTEASTSSPPGTLGTNTVTGSSSSRATPRSRVSSVPTNATVKASLSTSTPSSSRSVNIPRPRFMSTSASSSYLKSTSTSPRSASGSQLSSSPKSATKSTASTRSISPGNASGSSPRLIKTTISPSTSPPLRPAGPPPSPRLDTGAALNPNRLSSVSTASDYSQKSFADDEPPLPTTNPKPFQKERAYHDHPVDDPGGGSNEACDDHLGDDASTSERTDRSAIKSGYGSVFGFNTLSRSSGSPTSTYSPSRSSPYSYASSHISQSSISSNCTLPASQPTAIPIISETSSELSTPTAHTASFPHHGDFRTSNESSAQPTASAPHDKLPSSFSTSTPSSTIPSHFTPNVNGEGGNSRPLQPVRPPRARPPPSKSPSSPPNPSISSPGDRLSANPTSPARSSSPVSASSSNSRPHSRSSRTSPSSASSPRRRKDPSLPVPVPPASPDSRNIRKATSNLSLSSSSTTRDGVSSKTNINVDAGNSMTAKSSPSGSPNNSRMISPRRSLPKVGMQSEDGKKDEQGKESLDSRNGSRARDRAGSSATVKASSSRPSVTTGSSASTKSGSASRPSSTSNNQSTSAQTQQSSSSRGLPNSPSISPSVNPPVQATISPTLSSSQAPSLTTTPPQAHHTGSHTGSPPRSQPRPHAHINSPPSPGMGVSLKQLLSKPAPPGYTSAGSASESEGHPARPFYDREKRLMHTRDDRLIRHTTQAKDDVALLDIQKDQERRREWEAERLMLKEKSMERIKVAGSERADLRGAVSSGDEGSRERGFGLVKSASLTRLRDRAEGKDDKGKDKDKRQRNVLRRKPSGNQGQSCDPNLGKTSPLPALDDQTIPSPRQNTTYASYATPMLPLSPTPMKSPRASPLLANTSGSTLKPLLGVSSSRDLPSLSGPKSRSKDRSTERVLSPSVAADSTSGDVVTPAKEIMLRYKRQQAAEASIQEKMEAKEREAEERNRAEMEKERNVGLRDGGKEKEKLPAETTAPRDFQSGGVNTSEAASAMPYFSVVGSTSGHVVALGKPEDSSYAPPPELLRKRSISQPASSAPRISSPDPATSLPEFSWDPSLTEGPDLSLSFGAESTGSGINGGKGLDGQVEGTLQLDEVWERRVSVTSPKPSRSSSVGVFSNKTLTRKLSAKWGKKSALGSFGSVGYRNSMDTGTVESVPVYVGAYGGIAEVQQPSARPSLQERRSSTGLGLGKRKVSISGLVHKAKGGDDVTNGGRNLRLSIDTLVEDVALKNQPLPGSADRPLLRSPTVSEPPAASSPNPAHYSHSAPQSGISPQLSPNSAAAPVPKGKVWNLMKRISTGGLRDKYHAPESASSGSPSPASPLFHQSPPPVPALPKDFASNRAYGGPSRTSLATIGTASGSPATSGRQSRASSAHTSTSAGSSKIPTPVTPGGIRIPPLPPITPSSPQARPGTGGTRSSSPISSDKASSKFFNRAHSRRSSASSYGEELPPPPLPTFNPNSSSGSLGTNTSTGSSIGKLSSLQHHIIPPGELHKIQMHLERGNVGSSSSIVSGPPAPAQTPKSSGKVGKGDDYMIVRTPAEEVSAFSLPVPPDWRGNRSRERGREDDDVVVRRPPPSEDGRPPSPIIPTFSTAGAINTWKKPKAKVERGGSEASRKSGDEPGRRSASIPRSQKPPPLSSISPPVPSRNLRRPHTSTSPSSPGFGLVPSSPTHSSRTNIREEELSSSSFSKVPSSPTRKSTSAIPTFRHRQAESGHNTTPQGPPTSVNRIVSSSSAYSRPAASAAPWDSPRSATSSSQNSPSNTSASSVPAKKGWGFWKTSLSEKEKAAKWDDFTSKE
ncbi:hypothetical protein D9758_002789 [Tetrapyrgos nigripes]|uniref:Uncharacterized protein n=1 Tax=Tetrapyrgos nigripes TaxID=182062 RepID=A0A8H5GQS7_9AGAR|nr:hypothetical protein D9758_002789 [Tetrapyrgos nigripes]